MVTTNYQKHGTKGFQLRFRMYQNGEVRYISVQNLLLGSLYAKHWNQKKQCFIPSAPHSEENNRILAEFKQKHDLALMNWEGSLFSYAVDSRSNGGEAKDNSKTLKYGMEWVVEQAKASVHSDGTTSGNYENYQKIIKRMEEYCKARHIKFNNIKLDDVNEAMINDCLKWMSDSKGGKGQYFSTMFRAALNKMAKVGWVDPEMVLKCNWKKKIKNYSRKYETLTPDQCNRLIEMKHSELPNGHAHYPQLYYDFCVFILYTCQSACDALSMKYSNIQRINGVDHLVFKRRKIENKQAVDCVVPINDTMKKIMKRWEHLSKDGYIFPVRNKTTLKKYKDTNMDIKRFTKRCNVWLKKLGDVLGCDFPLHTYVFRHTAITHYISKGVPVLYVANLAGTSVDNCEKIYYNNQGDTKSRDMVMKSMSF